MRLPSPDEKDLGLKAGVTGSDIDEIRSGVGNGPVEKPVGGRGHGKRLGADLEREDLSSDYPGAGAPRAGEEEDVDTDKGNETLLSCAISHGLASAYSSNDCNLVSR